VGDQAKIQVVGPDFTFSDAQTDIVNEIAMSKISHKPKMIIWLLHVAIKKQIIYT
jgi:hypothetical protein